MVPFCLSLFLAIASHQEAMAFPPPVGGSSNHSTSLRRRTNAKDPWFLPDNPFVSPGPNDLRSPCPFTNAMANHGFVNRDGRDVDLFDMVQQMEVVFDLSSDFVDVVANNTINFNLTHEADDGTVLLDLDRLFEHHGEEHDASFVRQDSGLGMEASLHVDRGLLQALTAAGGKVVLAEDLMRFQFDRIIEGRKYNPEFEVEEHEVPLMAAQAITLLFLQDSFDLSEGVPKNRLKRFLRWDGRIPNGFVPRGMRDPSFQAFNFFDENDFTSIIFANFIANIEEALTVDLNDY